MGIEDLVKALTPGCCTEKAAREKGCALCVGRFDAVAEVRRMHAELEALRRPVPHLPRLRPCPFCRFDNVATESADETGERVCVRCPNCRASGPSVSVFEREADAKARARWGPRQANLLEIFTPAEWLVHDGRASTVEEAEQLLRAKHGVPTNKGPSEDRPPRQDPTARGE